MKEAKLYRPLEGGKVRCLTCAHGCTIAQGKRGICRVRENHDGRLYSLVYGKAIALHVDPIEKKPLFHFYPGTRAFSMATVGCNFKCLNCQNADISQMPKDSDRIEGREMPPEQVVQAALDHRCLSISYTYTEPAVYWDYAFDTAVIAHERGLKNTFVTNGYFSEEALSKILPLMDGVNVDLKAFRDEVYRSNCGARLQPVLDTIQRIRDAGVWIEVTTLLIPGLNDSGEEIRDIAEYIVKVDPGIPWHVSRFHPTYRMIDRPATPTETIGMACEIGIQAGLRYVYTGNLPGDERESTFCHSCSARLVHRWGFQVQGNRIIDGKCPECDSVIDGVW